MIFTEQKLFQKLGIESIFIEFYSCTCQVHLFRYNLYIFLFIYLNKVFMVPHPFWRLKIVFTGWGVSNVIYLANWFRLNLNEFLMQIVSSTFRAPCYFKALEAKIFIIHLIVWTSNKLKQCIYQICVNETLHLKLRKFIV